MSDAAEYVAGALQRVVQRHGLAAVGTRAACVGLLKDHVGGMPGAGGYVNLLGGAAEAKIVQELLAAPAGVQRRLVIERLADRIAEQWLVPRPVGRWAVEAWDAAVAAQGDAAADGDAAAAPGVNGNDVLRAVFGVAERAALRVPGLGRLFESDELARGDEAGDTIELGLDAASDALAHAVAGAPEGTSIRVRGGIHVGPLVFDRTVYVTAHPAGPRPVLTSPGGSTVVIRDGGGTLAGFDVLGPAGDAAAVDCSGGHPELRDCRVTAGQSPALRVRGDAADPAVVDCTLHSKGGPAAVVFETRARGRLTGCTVAGHPAGDGLVVLGDADPIVRLTRIEDASVGVRVDARGRGQFDNCSVRRCRTALAVIAGRSRPTFRQCGFRESQAVGVLLDSAAVARLDDCVIDLCGGDGLRVTGRSTPFVRRGRVTRCGHTGIYLHSSTGAVLRDIAFDHNFGDDLRIEPHPDAADRPTVVCPQLSLPPDLRTTDPRAVAPRGTFRALLIIALLAAVAGAGAVFWIRHRDASIAAAAGWGAAALAVVPLVLWLLTRRDVGVRRRAFAVMLIAFAGLGAFVGGLTTLADSGPGAGAVVAGVLTACGGLVLEAKGIVARLRRR